MAAAGKKLEDDDLIGYILNGLDSEYNPFVSSISIKDTLTLSDVYAQLLSYEARLVQQRTEEFRSYSSASTTSRGRGRGNFRGRGPSSGSGCGYNSNSSNNSNTRTSSTEDQDEGPLCQLCERYGHTVHDCWYRFNKKYVPPRDGGAKPIRQGPQKSTSSAVPYYGVDTNWYFDSGSTDHITNDLEKLSTHERYSGKNQIHTANGKGMRITHIGKSVYHTPTRDFSFNNILHVPDSQKNLLSVHQFT